MIEVTEYEPIAGGYSRSIARARVRYTSDAVTLEEMTDFGEHPTRLARLWGQIHTITPDQFPDVMARPARTGTLESTT